MRGWLSGLGVALTATLAVSCAPSPEPSPEPTPSPSPAESREQPSKEPATGPQELRSDASVLEIEVDDVEGLPIVVDSCTDMGMTALEGRENVVFSPLSWCMALGMVASGTSNQARTDVEDLLGADVETINEAFNALAGELAAHEGDPSSVDAEDPPEQPIVHRATNTAIQSDFEVEQAYLDDLAAYYDSGVISLDLSSMESKAVLDAWVREHTAGRIQDSGVEPNPALRVVLLDALLFAAAWDEPFNEPTLEMQFTNYDGTVSEMPRVGALRTFDYAEFEGWKAARVPYTDGFTATFYLPVVDSDPLTLRVRDEVTAAMQPTHLDFVVPGFELGTTTDLLQLFQAYGLESLTNTDAAPLDGIAPDEGLVITTALQQSEIAVMAGGTVASAVTTVEMGTGAPRTQPPEAALHLTRPFFITITHDETNTDLFQVAVRHLEGPTG